MTRAVAIALLLTSSGVAAQTSRADPVDTQIWAGSAVKFDLPNRWEAGIEYRARWVDNGSSYRGSYLTLEGSRRVADMLTAYSSYRLALVDGGNYHRIAVGIEAEWERSALTLSLRPSFQYQQQNFADNDEGDADAIARLRARARYEVTGSFDAYVSVEPYFKFGADYPIDNWRNTAGLRYHITNAVRIDAFYIYRPDYAKSYNRTFHVFGAELNFEVK